MPDIKDIIFPLALMLGNHEMGHINEADRLNVPASFDKNMAFIAKTNDKRKLSRIAGAGFKRQDKLSNILEGEKLEKPVRLLSALNKLGYAIFPKSIQGGTGDVQMIEDNQGKEARQFAQGALILSAASDLSRVFSKKKSNKGLSFGQTKKGTPMLMFGGRF